MFSRIVLLYVYGAALNATRKLGGTRRNDVVQKYVDVLRSPHGSRRRDSIFPEGDSCWFVVRPSAPQSTYAQRSIKPRTIGRVLFRPGDCCQNQHLTDKPLAFTSSNITHSQLNYKRTHLNIKWETYIPEWRRIVRRQVFLRCSCHVKPCIIKMTNVVHRIVQQCRIVGKLEDEIHSPALVLLRQQDLLELVVAMMSLRWRLLQKSRGRYPCHMCQRAQCITLTICRSHHFLMNCI